MQKKPFPKTYMRCFFLCLPTYVGKTRRSEESIPTYLPTYIGTVPNSESGQKFVHTHAGEFESAPRGLEEEGDPPLLNHMDNSLPKIGGGGGKKPGEAGYGFCWSVGFEKLYISSNSPGKERGGRVFFHPLFAGRCLFFFRFFF